MFSSLVRCVFFFHLFFFPCFEFRVVWGSAPFVVLFVLSFHCLILCAFFGSSRFVSLRIEGRQAKEFELGGTGGGLGSPAAVVVGVLPLGYLPPPGKGKGKISEIRYPCSSEYLRATVRYANAMGPSRIEPSYVETFATCYGPSSGVLTFSHCMLFPFPRWSTSLKRPLRTIFASHCTPLLKASYNTSMCAHPSSLLIFGASW